MFSFFGISEFIGSSCVEFFCSCKCRNPKWPHSLIEFRDSAITLSVVHASSITKRRNPILAGPHTFSCFRELALTLCSVFASGVSKPRNPKLLGPHPNRISHFGFSCFILFVRRVFVNPEIPNPETPKCWSHFPFTFRNSGVVVCWRLAFEFVKS
jgi:hypothetical protein